MVSELRVGKSGSAKELGSPEASAAANAPPLGRWPAMDHQAGSARAAPQRLTTSRPHWSKTRQVTLARGLQRSSGSAAVRNFARARRTPSSTRWERWLGKHVPDYMDLPLSTALQPLKALLRAPSEDLGEKSARSWRTMSSVPSGRSGTSFPRTHGPGRKIQDLSATSGARRSSTDFKLPGNAAASRFSKPAHPRAVALRPLSPASGETTRRRRDTKISRTAGCTCPSPKGGDAKGVQPAALDARYGTDRRACRGSAPWIFPGRDPKRPITHPMPRPDADVAARSSPHLRDPGRADRMPSGCAGATAQSPARQIDNGSVCDCHR